MFAPAPRHHLPRFPLALGLAALLALPVVAARAQTAGPAADADAAQDERSCRDGALALYRDRCGVPAGTRAAAQATFEWDTLRGFGFEPGRVFELARAIPGDCPYVSFKTAIMSLDRQVDETTVSTGCTASPAASGSTRQGETVDASVFGSSEIELQERAFSLFFANCPVDRGSVFGLQVNEQWATLLELGHSPALIAQRAAILTPECQFTAFDAAILAMGLGNSAPVEPAPLLSLPDDDLAIAAGAGADHDAETRDDPDLLSDPEWATPDRVPPAGPAALMAIGTATYLGGFVAAAAPDESRVFYQGHPVRIALAANLMTVGIPTAVVGGVLLGKGYSEVDNPTNLETWRRAEAAKRLHLPYLIMGLLMTGTGVGMGVWGTPADEMARSGLWVIPLAGSSTLTAGLALSAMGDAAAADLFGRESSWDDAPGRLLLKAGVAFLAVGGGAAAVGGLLCMPFELAVGGDGTFSGRVALTGLPFLVAGVPMLVAGIQRIQRAEREHPGFSRAPGRRGPTLVAVAPLHDPRTGTTGLSMSWVF